MFFPCSSSLQLQAYSNATWTSDPWDRRSLFAYCVFLGGSLTASKTKKRTFLGGSLTASKTKKRAFLGGSLTASKTKKQTTVSHLSAEAEPPAMALLPAEVTWSRWLLQKFGISV